MLFDCMNDLGEGEKQGEMRYQESNTMYSTIFTPDGQKNGEKTFPAFAPNNSNHQSEPDKPEESEESEEPEPEEPDENEERDNSNKLKTENVDEYVE